MNELTHKQAVKKLLQNVKEVIKKKAEDCTAKESILRKLDSILNSTYLGIKALEWKK